MFYKLTLTSMNEGDEPRTVMVNLNHIVSVKETFNDDPHTRIVTTTDGSIHSVTTLSLYKAMGHSEMPYVLDI